MNWRRRASQHRLQLFASPLERFAPPIAIPFGKQIEKDHRCRTLLRKQFNSRRRWMKPKLQFLEVEPIVLCDHDFAVENASIGQLRTERFEQVRKISIQRFRIAALNKNFVSAAKDQRTKPVPLRLEDSCFSHRHQI